MKRTSTLRVTAIAIGIAAAFAGANTASAGSAFTNLTVQASVAANCTIATGTLNFGAYDPVVANASTALTGTGTVTVACTKGSTGLWIGLDNGANFSSSRRMAGGGDFLSYSLYVPPNNTPGTACSYTSPTAWGNTLATGLSLTSPASKTGRTYNVCGSIAGGQDVTVAATYSDTVVATINF